MLTCENGSEKAADESIRAQRTTHCATAPQNEPIQCLPN